MIDEREIYLRASYNVEIRDVELRLNNDIKTIHDEHQQYVDLFKDLK
jgi:hypothetical protein